MKDPMPAHGCWLEHAGAIAGEHERVGVDRAATEPAEHPRHGKGVEAQAVPARIAAEAAARLPVDELVPGRRLVGGEAEQVVHAAEHRPQRAGCEPAHAARRRPAGVGRLHRGPRWPDRGPARHQRDAFARVAKRRRGLHQPVHRVGTLARELRLGRRERARWVARTTSAGGAAARRSSASRAIGRHHGGVPGRRAAMEPGNAPRTALPRTRPSPLSWGEVDVRTRATISEASSVRSRRASVEARRVSATSRPAAPR